MIKKLILVFLILNFNLPIQAQPFHKLTHYVAHHKAEIICDTLIFFALNADAASSIKGRDVGTLEQNPILGIHPSDIKYLGYGNSIVVGSVLINHFIWKFPKTGGEAFVAAIPSLTLGMSEYEVTVRNVHVIETCERLHCNGEPSH